MQTSDNNFRLTLLVSGKPIQEFHHKNNVFVEGRKGSNFSIEFRNNTFKTVLAVPSVDGISPLDGKVATPASKGYIVGPHSSITIPGWTIDDNSVAAFQFQDKENSYSALMQSSNKVITGVIGMLVYEEKKAEFSFNGFPKIIPEIGKPNPYFSSGDPSGALYVPLDHSAMIVNSSQNASLSASTTTDQMFDVGVGWGDKEQFKVKEKSFVRGNRLAQMVIYYDSRRNLEKRGIKVVKDKNSYLDVLPEPFSGMGCPVPPGWKG